MPIEDCSNSLPGGIDPALLTPDTIVPDPSMTLPDDLEPDSELDPTDIICSYADPGADLGSGGTPACGSASRTTTTSFAPPTPNYQGWGWYQNSRPELVVDSVTSPTSVRIVAGARRVFDFNLVSGSSPKVFVGVNAHQGLVEHIPGTESTPELYQYRNRSGRVYTFFGYNTNGTAWVDPKGAKGQLWKIQGSDGAGSASYVGHPTDPLSALSGFVQDSGDATPRAQYIYDSAGRLRTYTYTNLYGTSIPMLSSVVITVGSTEVQRVEYLYYTSGDSANGLPGDLKFVIWTTPLSSGGDLVETTYLRYYTDAEYHSTNHPGFVHQLKMMVGPEGMRRYGSGYASATDAQLMPYALRYYKYEPSYGKVWQSFENGDCGCGGQVNGWYSFSTVDNATYSSSLDYTPNGATGTSDWGSTRWKRRTIIDRPDGTKMAIYFDEMNLWIGRVITDAATPSTPWNPSNNTLWITKLERDGRMRPKRLFTPEAVDSSSYGHNTAYGEINTRSSAGLVRVVEYYAPTSPCTYNYLPDAVTLRKLVIGSATSGNPELKQEEIAYADPTSCGSAIATYTSTGTAGRIARALPVSRKLYRDNSTSDETTYEYTFHSGWQVKSATTTLPKVAPGENGEDAHHTRARYFDTKRRTVFEKDESDVYDWTGYDSTTGQVTSRIKDAKSGSSISALNSDATAFSISLPSGGYQIETSYTYDLQGRSATTTVPGHPATTRTAARHYTQLGDGRMVVLTSPRRTGTDPSFTYYGPATYEVVNLVGGVEASGTIALAGSGGTTTTAMSSWVSTSSTNPLTAVSGSVGSLSSLTTTIFSESGTRRGEIRRYSALGSSPVYDATTYAYDDMGRLTTTTDATGTITEVAHDALGRIVETWIGTSSSNEVRVSSTQFDNNGIGNGLVTRATDQVDASSSNDRQTDYKYDGFDRRIATVNPESPHRVVAYDNQGRVTASAEYSTSSLSGSSVPTTTTNRLSYAQTYFDSRGQMWKQTTHAIGSSGASSDSLDLLMWYDDSGREVKRRGTSLTKTAYDRIGRAVREYVLASDNDTGYTDTTSVSGDTVLEESQTYIESSTSLPLMRITIRRNPNDTTTTGALDTDSDLSFMNYSGSAIKGRGQIATYFYDWLSRRTEIADRGTNAESNYDRDSESTAPSSSTSVLVARTTYGSDGRVSSTFDPMGREVRYTRDLLGRELSVIRNYVDGTPSADTDQKIEYVYDDGHLVSLTAKMPSSGDDQTTTYTYGVDKDSVADSGSGGFVSGISSNRLLYKVTYPDSSGASDVVRYGYNRQGEVAKARDQAGNIIQTDFDKLARETNRRATTISSGFDDTVKRISLAYDTHGRVDTVTQYDNASVGSGTALDQVKYTYDAWGNVEKFEQDVDSAIGASGRGSFWTVYEFDPSNPTGGPHLVRRTQHQIQSTSGSSQTVVYSYGTSGGINDKASRLQSMSIGSATIASYQYMGADTLVHTNLDQPSLNTGVFDSSSTTYPDLDQFDRPKRWDWWHGTDAAFYDVDIKYDFNSNPTAALDNMHIRSSTGKHIFDVAYSLDGLDRIVQADEGSGVWNGTSQQWEIESGYHTRNELWNSLTPTGNWGNRKLDANGDGGFTDASDRDEPSANNVFNKANEWTDRRVNRNAGQYDNYDYTYDAVGNLTGESVSINAGGSPTGLQQREFVYDVFGRMIAVKGGLPDEEGLPYIARYRYNGLGFRIMWQYDADADSTLEDGERYYFLYDERWRSLATYRNQDTNPKEQFVYHNAGTAGHGDASYIDSVVLRDKDANTAWTAASDGTLEERLYYVQNWRSDVVALWTSGGEPVEYVRYSAYGEPTCYPVGDANRDGVVNTTDSSEFYDCISGAYNAVAIPLDVNADSLFPDPTTDGGIIDASVAAHAGFTGSGKVSAVGNRIGYAGYQWDLVANTFHVRNRVYAPTTGRWSRRDRAEYVDGANVYEYVCSMSLSAGDPYGEGLWKWIKERFTKVHERKGAYWNYTIRCGSSTYAGGGYDRVDKIAKMLAGFKARGCLIVSLNINTHHSVKKGVVYSKDDKCDAVSDDDLIKSIPSLAPNARVDFNMCNSCGLAQSLKKANPAATGSEVYCTDGTNVNDPITGVDLTGANNTCGKVIGEGEKGKNDKNKI